MLSLSGGLKLVGLAGGVYSMMGHSPIWSGWNTGRAQEFFLQRSSSMIDLQSFLVEL